MAGASAVRIALARTEGGRATPAQSALLMRRLLADSLGGTEADWQVGHDPLGAPLPLRNGKRFPAFISISRTDGLAAAGLCRTAPLGIDIEVMRPHASDVALAETLFSPGERAVLEEAAAGDRGSVFFRIWTLKEAYLKARGRGFRIDPAAFAVAQPGQLPRPVLRDERHSGWALAALSVDADVSLGLAVRSEAPLVRC